MRWNAVPELPEVETVVKGLRPLIKDRYITDITISEEKIIAHPAADEFKKEAVGMKIEDITRRGKYIIIELENDKEMIIHLRMTGKLLVKQCEKFRDKHTHVVFHLDNGQELRFNNIRKFGRIYLIDKDQPQKAGGYAELGPEPLSNDMSLDDFKEMFKNRRGVIKSLLMNQKFIAGIGNIYADEILFRSGIDPERKADTLSEMEIGKIYSNMREILKKGIIYGGTTFSDYVNAFGEKGSFQEELQIYQKEGEKCCRCGSTVKKKRVGGRGSYYCPSCQK